MLSISRLSFQPGSRRCAGCARDIGPDVRATVHALAAKLGHGPIARHGLCRSCFATTELLTSKILQQTPDIDAWFAARIGVDIITLPDGSAYANAAPHECGDEDITALHRELALHAEHIRLALLPALWLFYLMRADATFSSFDSLLRVMGAGRIGAPLHEIDGPIGLHGPALACANILMLRTSAATGELIGYAKIAGMVRALGVLAPAHEAIARCEFLFAYDLAEDRDRTREFRVDADVFEHSLAAWRRKRGLGL